MTTRSSDEEIARSEQLAMDMQFAFDLQAQEDTARRPQHVIVPSRPVASAPTESDGFCSGFNGDHMLYVACEVEGRLVEMLVDSGASSSAISKGEMKRLNLHDKLNTRFAGKAVGCGSANVLGIVENVIVSIGHAEFRLFFLVLDTENPLLILGLDQMRKFKCLIDLEENKLVFGGKGGVEVQFLPTGDDSNVMDHYQDSRRMGNGDCNMM